MTDLIINFSDPKSKELLWSVLKGLTGEQVIKIKLREVGKTLPQGKYYWGVVLAYIEDYTGVSKYILHEFFKHEFIPLVKFTDDYRLTTRDLSKKEKTDYIDKVVKWALDYLGIKIPPSDGVIL